VADHPALAAAEAVACAGRAGPAAPRPAAWLLPPRPRGARSCPAACAAPGTPAPRARRRSPRANAHFWSALLHLSHARNADALQGVTAGRDPPPSCMTKAWDDKGRTPG
jgi:hypothetical protein